VLVQVKASASPAPNATNNIGLTNVLLRLLLNFGQECSMELYANELGGTTVHLIISHKTLWNQKPTDT
jgi:two-component system sensor histidine kinase YesM